MESNQIMENEIISAISSTVLGGFKVTYFITVLDGVITGSHCGNLNVDFTNTEFHGHERIAVPPNTQVVVSDKVTYYDKNWQRRPDSQLVAEGLMPMPVGHKLVDGELMLKMPASEVIAGVDGFKNLVADYKIEANGVLPETLNEDNTIRNRALETVDAELTRLVSPRYIAHGQLDAEFESRRLQSIREWLDVENQPSFPAEIDWPEIIIV